MDADLPPNAPWRQMPTPGKVSPIFNEIGIIAQLSGACSAQGAADRVHPSHFSSFSTSGPDG